MASTMAAPRAKIRKGGTDEEREAETVAAARAEIRNKGEREKKKFDKE